jgi:hypothetical protein
MGEFDPHQGLPYNFVFGVLTMPNPWRLIEWSDVRGRMVRELAFHESETEEVINLPFPSGAIAREPVMELTHFARAKRYRYFRRRFQPLRIGDTFYEHINQGDRLCKVVAFDEESGCILYDYEMPAGRIFYRDDSGPSGRPVSPNRPPKKWREYFS